MDASPVNVLIAPDREVLTGKLEDGLAGFYRALFSDGEINAAFEKHLGEPFKLFLAERFFVIAVCKYIRNVCKGKGASVRRERLRIEHAAEQLIEIEIGALMRHQMQQHSRDDRQHEVAGGTAGRDQDHVAAHMAEPGDHRNQ